MIGTIRHRARARPHPARSVPAAGGAADARATLPRLPALEHWLARAHDRRWPTRLARLAAARGLGAARGRRAPARAAAAAALRPQARASIGWLATPVHLVAGLDTVRLHPAGLLRLQRGAAAHAGRGLRARVRRLGLAAACHWRRARTAAGGPVPLARSAQPTIRRAVLGADPRAGLPRGAGARDLRRLGAEIEMWLHQHPVNRARAARRELPRQRWLWLWGGAARQARAASGRGTAAAAQQRLVLYADDLFAPAWLSRRAAPQPLPERWHGPMRAGSAMLRGRRAAAPRRDCAARLRALERDWFAPALAALARRRGSQR